MCVLCCVVKFFLSLFFFLLFAVAFCCAIFGWYILAGDGIGLAWLIPFSFDPAQHTIYISQYIYIYSWWWWRRRDIHNNVGCVFSLSRRLEGSLHSFRISCVCGVFFGLLLVERIVLFAASLVWPRRATAPKDIFHAIRYGCTARAWDYGRHFVRIF